MSRSCRIACLAVIVAALPLLGCTAEPWTTAHSERGITLRWWSDEVADAEAHNVAGSYCTQLGKSVAFDSIERDGSASIGRYRCI